MDESVTSDHKCAVCEKTFSKSSNLYAHLRKIHGEEPTFPKMQIVCSLCQENFSSNVKYEEHLELHHDIKLTRTDLKLNSVDDFQEWKKNIESSTNSEFVLKCGAKRKKDEKISYYYCHRSGVFQGKGQGQRCIKSYGSAKIGANCPARIKLTENENGVVVEFTETHVGHKDDVGKLHISEEERLRIFSQLQQDVPITKILDKIRDAASENSERTNLITRRDILNIKKQYNVNDDGVLDANDMNSVQKWVESFQDNDSPVIVFKQQHVLDPSFPELSESDFLLVLMNAWQKKMLNLFGNDIVCMDFTHGLNQYNFDLATLLVVDDKREGLPSAFIFSNRHDSVVLSIALNAVKNSGVNISPKTFMSDDDNTFYNAWKNVFSEVDRKILCTWHVDKNWRKKLNECCKKENQAIVYKYLLCLQHETDQNAFKKLLVAFLEYLKKDPSTYSFAEYFEINYANRPEMWAYCYRLWCGINTNMYLESLHKTLKYIYLDGKKVKRLDKTINVLLKFVRDKMFDRLIMLEKGKVSTSVSNIRKRHKLIMTVSTEMISENENGWLVPSFTNIGEIYNVKRKDNCDNCPLTCEPCGYCLHSFTCNCLDNSVQSNMCKHIHLVCKKLKEEAEMATEKEESNYFGDLVIATSSQKEQEKEDLILDLKNKDVSANDLRQKINAMSQDILKSVDSCSSISKLKSVYKIMQRANDILLEGNDKKKFSIDTPTNEPSNKKIAVQRYTTTKKKAVRKKNMLSKPSPSESLDLSCSLLLSTKSNSEL